MRRLVMAVLAIGLVLGLANGSYADQAVSFTPDTANDLNDTSWSLGWSFTVGASDIRVTSLGFYDRSTDGTGLTMSHQVGIYASPWASDESGVPVGDPPLPLVEVTVLPAPYNYSSYFHWTDIASTGTVLTAGQTYYVMALTGKIVSTEMVDDPWNPGQYVEISTFESDPYAFIDKTALSIPADIIFGQCASYSPYANSLFPPISTSLGWAEEGGFFGPNFQYEVVPPTPVPEPSCLFFLLSGLGGLTFLRRFRGTRA